MKWYTKSAFTLIEMLIVIVIIGVLAAALVPRLLSVQGRARDTKRKADLRSIYNANEIYIVDNGRYPRAGGCADHSRCGIVSTDAQPRIAALSGIMTSIPVDPLNQGTVPTYVTGNMNYTYYGVFTLQSGGINTYDLITNLENTSDPDRCLVNNINSFEIKQIDVETGLNQSMICLLTGKTDRSKSIKHHTLLRLPSTNLL